MKELVWGKAFEKDLKRLAKRGKNRTKLADIMGILANGAAIPIQYKDHPLTGSWNGYRDLHIEPDWLLIYQHKDENTVHLARTGTHADIFS